MASARRGLVVLLILAFVLTWAGCGSSGSAIEDSQIISALNLKKASSGYEMNGDPFCRIDRAAQRPGRGQEGPAPEGQQLRDRGAEGKGRRPGAPALRARVQARGPGRAEEASPPAQEEDSRPAAGLGLDGGDEARATAGLARVREIRARGSHLRPGAAGGRRARGGPPHLRPRRRAQRADRRLPFGEGDPRRRRGRAHRGRRNPRAAAERRRVRRRCSRRSTLPAQPAPRVREAVERVRAAAGIKACGPPAASPRAPLATRAPVEPSSSRSRAGSVPTVTRRRSSTAGHATGGSSGSEDRVGDVARRLGHP